MENGKDGVTMKLVDYFTQHEKLTNEVMNNCRLCGYASTNAEAKVKEEEFRKNNEKVLRSLRELDDLTNRIFEVMATNYVEVDGVRLSLMTIHHYINNFRCAFGFQPMHGLESAVACAVPSFPANYANARRFYLESLERGRFTLPNEDEDIFVDPLGLKSRDGGDVNNYLSDLRNAYVKKVAEIEV